MRIDKKLNIVMTIHDAAGSIYIHSTPISQDIFEQYYMVLSRSYSLIYTKGMHLVAPKVAHLILKQLAEEEGVWESVKNGLMNEIIRLSNVITPSDNGYITNTLSDALSRKIILEKEFNEIKGMLVFFTCVSLVAQKIVIEATLIQMTELWGGQITSLNSTEYKDSLQNAIEEQILEKSEIQKLVSIPY